MKNFSHVHFLILLFTLSVFKYKFAYSQTFLVKSFVKKNSIQKTIVSISPSVKQIKGKSVVLRYLPQFLFEDQKSSDLYLKEELINDRSLATFKIPKLKFKIPGEVLKIVENGPPENRINLTIIGDGYTASSRQKFFLDAKRITDGLFQGVTFSSYLKLFNVYAIFIPSFESGIGDGSPRNTALGLYRTPKGSRRAIMCDRPSIARQAAELAPKSDFPILLANDDYYGGLGGEFAITTSSLQSSLIVLRHELGHNFGNVGEEYSGGDVYQGANYSNGPQLPWSKWLSQGMFTYRSKLLAGDYPWTNLKNGPVNVPISIPDGNFNVIGEISGVGWKTSDEVEVKIDNKKFPLDGKFQQDRSFFNLGPVQLPKGQHNFEFKENVLDADNVLGYYKIFAYPMGYNFNENFIAGFSVFSRYGTEGFRPTHRSCLMNRMTYEKFCSIDQENMWHQFLKRVSLIDEVIVQGNSVEVKTLDLPQLDIRWFSLDQNGNENEMAQYRNLKKIVISKILSNKYQFRVRVNFITSEVRQYNNNFTDSEDFNL